MSSDCGACTAKFILCAFNFIFFILGTVVLGIGVWLVADKSSFMGLLEIIDHDNSINLGEPEVIDQIAYVLVAAGGIMFFLSFLGYCGALRESQCLLTTYGIFLMILLVLEIAVGGLAVAYKDQTKLQTREYLKQSISKSYGDERTPDVTTKAWMAVMVSFKCCGVDNSSDFNNVSHFMKNGTFVMPVACCKMNDKNEPADKQCPLVATTENSYKDTGCFESIIEVVMKHQYIAIATLIVAILAQLAAIFLSFCLCKSLDKCYDTRI